MNEITATGEPATELERLIAELSESGLLVFVFGERLGDRAPHRSDQAAIPRAGRPAVVARRTRRRRGELDRWTCGSMRSPGSGSCASPTRSRRSPGGRPCRCSSWGPAGTTVLNCYVHELYDGQRMRPEKLAAWRALRERYGNRDESRVDRGTLLASGCLNRSRPGLS